MRPNPAYLRLYFLGSVLTCLIVGGCSGDETLVEDVDLPDVLLTSNRIESVSIDRINSFGAPITPQSAVDLLRISYRTVDGRGDPTRASAVIAVPTSIAGPLALASYQHGTVVRRTDVASVRGLDNPESLVAVVFAATGYLAVMPDYIGLGESEGLHPFVHAESLASAVVDAMRAARNFAAREGIALEDEVYLLGYSEGGYATAAAQRMIEQELADEFVIGASAPMAGPYDLSGSMVDLLSSDAEYPAPFFLPYTLLAYNDVYDIAESPSDFMVAPYDASIPPLFDGTNSGGDIDVFLPGVPKQILTDGFVTSIQTVPTDPWRVRLEENTLLSWAPRAPTHLYHCINDELIPVQNSQAAIESFYVNGSSRQTVDLITGDYGRHAECAAVFIVLAKFWIDDLRKNGPGKVSSEDVAAAVGARWRPISESSD